MGDDFTKYTATDDHNTSGNTYHVKLNQSQTFFWLFFVFVAVTTTDPSLSESTSEAFAFPLVGPFLFLLGAAFDFSSDSDEIAAAVLLFGFAGCFVYFLLTKWRKKKLS